METSDSEYFESADEDFESDYEESEKKDEHGSQSIMDEKNEPELCKLTIAEKQETSDELTKKTPEDKVANVEISTIKIDHSNNENKQSQEENNESDKLKPNKYVELKADDTTQQNQCVDLNIDKPKEKDTDSIKPVNSVVESSTKIDDNPILPNLEKKNESTVNERPNSSTGNPLINPRETDNKQNKLIQPEKEEENLWDDDEIDWGSEGIKEESQRTEEPSQNSKNEDSGWDDFDTEWDSSPAQETQTKLDPPKIIQSSTKENLWEDDEEWESIEKPQEKSKEPESTWGGWGGWGVSSIINTATQSVSTLTSHVSQGLSTVLETGIGIPEPEEMARMNKLRTEKDEVPTNEPDDSENSSGGFGLGNLVSGVSQLTKFVESTGTKVITGGLDTLEAIGKKTVEVLQEGDPGLKKKRAYLKLDTGKPNLSQMLREAKEKAEEENQTHSEIQSVKKFKNYEALFDDHHGLVHLEALEMLSKLCNIKLDNINNSLSGDALKDMQETLDQVRELCELPEDEEDEKISIDDARDTISNAVKEINIPISYTKLFGVCEETDAWLKNIDFGLINDLELHQEAIDMLAQLTALAVEQFHKAGELLLVKEHRSTADEADSLVQITTTVKSLILSEASKFTDKFNNIENADKDKISEHITNIFYEAANSGTYIQDAFQLLIPVLQVGAV